MILICLRLTIGFHFLSEGWKKVEDPKPFSAGFFRAAKGPLAPLYRSMIWDPDGKARLCYAESADGKVGHNLEPTFAAWEAFLARAGRYYGFQAEHENLANQKLELRKSQLQDFFRSNGSDVKEYFLGLQRRDRAVTDPTIQSVESLWGQAMTVSQELAGKRDPWLGEIETIWAGLENDMYVLGGKQRGPLKLKRAGRSWLDTETLDAVVPYFDMAIGFCLILGLFTAPASLVGAAFLGSIALSQWPWAAGVTPAWPQWVEMFGLLALAALSAGRFCGVDAVLAAWRASRRQRRNPTADAS